tara:strand:+ start:758 stop:1459 length:702 start_codon:yes stop_codon:yes gene_type:complete
MSNVQIHPFNTQPPETPFAPYWNYVIACKKTDIDAEEFAKLILIKEKEIKEEYPTGSYQYSNYSDGSTGLGSNSLTSRYSFFNVLKWDHPICKELHDNIRTFHNEYLYGTIGQTKFPEKLLKIRCWANVMRKGEKIKRHCHATHPFTYLSGHFTVKCDNTSTNYFNVYTDESYPIKNAPSQMTLFPTWIPHSTDRQKEDTERITIAFDIVCDDRKQFEIGHGKDPDLDNLVPL